MRAVILPYSLALSALSVTPYSAVFFAGVCRTRSNGLPYSLRKSVHALYSCGGGMVTCIAQICFIRGFLRRLFPQCIPLYGRKPSLLTVISEAVLF